MVLTTIGIYAIDSLAIVGGYVTIKTGFALAKEAIKTYKESDKKTMRDVAKATISKVKREAKESTQDTTPQKEA